MTKAALAAVPEADAPQHVTFPIGDGTVTMSTQLTGQDFLMFYRLAQVDVSSTDAVLELYGPMMDTMARHAVSHTLDSKPLLERPVPILRQVWNEWHRAMGEQALDRRRASS